MRVLLLEDAPADAELVKRELRKADPEVAVHEATDREDFTRALREFAPDVVISDHNLPQFSGWDALQLVRQTAPDVPFILVTGSLNEETAVSYMKAGAADYLLKDRIARLGPAVRAAHEQKRAREEEERARIAAEAALRTQRELLHAVIDLSPDLICVRDWDGRLVLVNQAFADLYGRTVKDLIGKTHADLHPNAADVERFLADDRAVMTGGRPKRAPEEPVTDARTGKVRWLQTVRVPLQLAGFDRPLILGVATDITERRQLEAQMRLAQKMEAVGTLAAGVAHDFNNLLAALRATAELMLLDAPEGAGLKADVGQMLEIVDRAAALTRQLLAFSRKQVLEARIVELNRVVSGMVRMLERVIGADVRLVLRETADDTTVLADPGQLEQVLMNLCVNARDAMPQGGELAILTDRVALDEEFCAVHPWARPGDFVRITVSDTGTGMDAATQARIFEPFFTTKQMGRGTGLGLAVVYGIVKQHGGLIHVYSEPGKGTAFRVYLPFHVEQPEPPPASAASEVEGGTETILLGEDDDALRATATRLLERLGYQVIAVANGREALDVLARRSGAVHLAILDVVMPELGGRAVFEEGSSRYPGVRFLFTTGYSPGTSHTAPTRALPVAVLQKPYGLRDLARAVRQALDGPGRRATRAST